MIGMADVNHAQEDTIWIPAIWIYRRERGIRGQQRFVCHAHQILINLSWEAMLIVANPVLLFVRLAVLKLEAA